MSYQPPRDDPLAYGEDYSGSRGNSQRGSDRSLVGDTLHMLKNRYDQRKTSSSSQNFGYTSSSGPNQGSNQGYYGQQGPSTSYPAQGQSAYPGGPPTQPPGPKPDMGTRIFDSLHGTINSIGSDVAGLLGTQYRPPFQQPQTQQQPYQATQGNQTYQNYPSSNKSRFDSFASDKAGNDVKWYVDGCSYFWAVSQALENARESIWILDWWLSPELYLRRPPSKNEQWRLDRVLQRAAMRGVKVNVIVYKEVTQVLSLSSSHTKHALEDLSPNIAVFRHPDHLPDAQTAESSLISSLQGLKLDAAGLSKLGKDSLKGMYGFSEDVILYWAHHEKLCLIDQRIAFMGGLDLCFGRWDTTQHAISDVHPSNIDMIVFPGQDYNNARVMDFIDVAQPFQNKLDRTKSSRMGWSDIAVCLIGPSVEDLRHHFIDRWNFIFNEKYNVRNDRRYYRLSERSGQPAGAPGAPGTQQTATDQQGLVQNYSQVSGPGGSFPPPPGSAPYTPPAWQSTSRPHTPNPQPSASEGYNQNYGQQHSTTQNYPPPPPGNPTSSMQAFPPPPPGPPPTTSEGYGALQQASNYQSPTSSADYSPYGAQQPPSTGYQASNLSQPYGTQQSYSATSGTYQTNYPSQVSELPSDQSGSQSHYNPTYPPPPTQGTRGIDDESSYGNERGFSADSQYNENERGFGDERGMRGKLDHYRGQGRLFGQELSSIGNMVSGGVENKFHQYQGRIPGSSMLAPLFGQSRGPMSCQILRSCTKWSNGTATEHSIQNAYIDIIQNSQHFVYIENQFFITATGDQQKPVKNMIGKALVDRILRAARSGQKYKVIVVIPSIPAFAGDLKDDDSLGTRAIMEFQYNSINRGGHSIMELIAQAGYNPMDYIRFYNLRNYDRLNTNNAMTRVEQQSGVSYEGARKEHDDIVGAGYGGSGEGTNVNYPAQGSQYKQYQAAAHNIQTPDSGRWDSVSECYMLNGTDIRNVPWSGPPEAELDAFVSEELYIHSKCLIADDRIVICGSANLNDRSQLGTHDSEIAIFVNDPTPVQSYMAGQPWTASRFASSLRRHLFRKHLGLLPPQDMQRPDSNFEPVGSPNAYDWNSPEDNIVRDPLSDTFLSLWNSRARTNTDVFRKAFRAVPDDNVISWTEYQELYGYYFESSSTKAQVKPGDRRPARTEYGHVVHDDFPGGVKELKDLLSQVRGTLVEMPLCFLQNEDIAKEGISLNAFTEEIYT